MEKKKFFMLTGFSYKTKDRLKLIIDRLGGICLRNLDDSQGFDNRCTHLVARKPRRSQKCMCACAKGCWILVADYLNESASVGAWLDENDFEWDESRCVTSEQVTLVKAARRWRKVTKNGKNCPFQDWVVGSALNTSFKIYQRFIEAGGGKAYSLEKSMQSAKDRKFTHILAEHRCKRALETYKKKGIPCIKGEFLAHWILQETPPLAENYSIYDDDLPIVASPSHATQQHDGNDAEKTLTEKQHDVIDLSIPASAETEGVTTLLNLAPSSTLLLAEESDSVTLGVFSNNDEIKSETETLEFENDDVIVQSELSKNSDVTDLDQGTPHDSSESNDFEMNVTVILLSDHETFAGNDSIGQDFQTLKSDDVATNIVEATCSKSDENCVDETVKHILGNMLDEITHNLNCVFKENTSSTYAANDECIPVLTNSSNFSQENQLSNSVDCEVSYNRDNKTVAELDIENSNENRNIVKNQETDPKVVKMEYIEYSNEHNTSNMNMKDRHSNDEDNVDILEHRDESPVAVFVADSPISTDQSSDQSDTANLSELTELADQILSQKEIKNEPVLEPSDNVTNVESHDQFHVDDDVTVGHYHQIPDWLKGERDILKSALQSLVQKNVSQTKLLVPRHNQQRDVSSGIRAQRFSDNELRILGNYVKSGHWNSVLLFSRSRLSNSAYPTHDLLYLVMKLYILESDNMNQTLEFVNFLNSVFLTHHPSTSHIRNDDIYLQAMSVTYSTESILLAGSRVNTAFAGNLWSNSRQDSTEWMFFSMVVTTALTCNDTQRKSNATLLLTFLSTVIESNPRIVRALFFYKDLAIVTPSVKLLFSWTRNATELVLQNSSDDGTADFDSDLNDDDFESDDYIVDPSDLEQALMKILNAFIRELEKTEGTNLKRIPYLLSQEVLHANNFTLQRLFSSITSLPIITSTIKLLLEEKCKPDLAKVKEKNCELSLHSLVERYFYFVPKYSVIFNENTTPPKKKLDESSESAKIDVPLAKDALQEEVYLLDNGTRVTSSTVNRRNLKGETLLHRSCIKNHPQVVAQVLKIPGVNPNMGDNVGWTPLGEACNHGNMQCVKELLSLPLGVVGSTPEQTSSLALYIDLLACPDEGTTPLHDALNCSHLEVAKLLVEKGGIELMRVIDRKGRTPLDLCTAEHKKVLLAIQDSKIDDDMRQGDRRTETFTQNNDYKKLLPPFYLISSEDWKKSCDDYVILLRQLLQYYVILADLKGFIQTLCKQTSDDVTDNDRYGDVITFHDRNISTNMTSRYESDIFYVLKWNRIEERFLKHIRNLSGNADYVIEKKFSAFSEETLINLKNRFPVNTNNTTQLTLQYFDELS